MNELYREIEEDIRQERLQRLWKGFGKVMVCISIAIVLLTATVVIVQNHRRTIAMEETGKFIKGIDRMNIEDYKGAIDAFGTLTSNTRSPYYGMAMLRKAQSQMALADKEGAQRTYQALAADNSGFGEVAKLMASGNNEPIAVPDDKKSPFYYSLSEWKGWQLHDAHKDDAAVEIFLSLYHDNSAPATLRQRMQEVLQHMAPQKLADAATAAKKD